jgi:hypothetical protein
LKKTGGDQNGVTPIIDAAATVELLKLINAKRCTAQ